MGAGTHSSNPSCSSRAPFRASILQILVGRCSYWTNATRDVLDCNGRDRCPERCHCHPVLQECGQHTFDEVRIDLPSDFRAPSGSNQAASLGSDLILSHAA